MRPVGKADNLTTFWCRCPEILRVTPGLYWDCFIFTLRIGLAGSYRRLDTVIRNTNFLSILVIEVRKFGRPLLRFSPTPTPAECSVGTSGYPAPTSEYALASCTFVILCCFSIKKIKTIFSRPLAVWDYLGFTNKSHLLFQVHPLCVFKTSKHFRYAVH